MPSAFELIGRNPALQEHWIRRFFAFIIDFIITLLVFLMFAIPLTLLGSAWFLSLTFLSLILFLYSMLLDTLVGGTVGKKLFALRVVAIDRNFDLLHGILRNLPKMLFPFLLIVDVLIGAAMAGDPRQRLFDRLAHTTVTRVDQGAYMEEQFRMMQHPMPHPMKVPAPPKGTPPPGKQAAAPEGSWPGQPPSKPSEWPQHQWDEEGKLVKERKYCTACGGQLVSRGDGKLTCIRCGAAY